MALSADGRTALIGGPGDNKGVGAAWHGSGHLGGQFGASLALSYDGHATLIGGPRDDPALYEDSLRPCGAAWTFTRSGSAWTQQGGKLGGCARGKYFSYGGIRFGESVGLSSDGDTALIGAPHASHEDPDLNAGLSWAFTRSGPTWTQQGDRSRMAQKSRSNTQTLVLGSRCHREETLPSLFRTHPLSKTIPRVRGCLRGPARRGHSNPRSSPAWCLGTNTSSLRCGAFGRCQHRAGRDGGVRELAPQVGERETLFRPPRAVRLERGAGHPLRPSPRSGMSPCGA